MTIDRIRLRQRLCSVVRIDGKRGSCDSDAQRRGGLRPVLLRLFALSFRWRAGVHELLACADLLLSVLLVSSTSSRAAASLASLSWRSVSCAASTCCNSSSEPVRGAGRAGWLPVALVVRDLLPLLPSALGALLLVGGRICGRSAGTLDSVSAELCDRFLARAPQHRPGQADMLCGGQNHARGSRSPRRLLDRAASANFAGCGCRAKLRPTRRGFHLLAVHAPPAELRAAPDGHAVVVAAVIEVDVARGRGGLAGACRRCSSARSA